MTNEPIRIPVLRAGKPYESLEQSEVKDLRTGAVLAVVDQANAGIVRRDLKKQDEHFAALRAIPIAERLRLCKRAGELFLRGRLPIGPGCEQGPDEYVQTLSRTSGLSHAMVRANMAKVHTVLDGMDVILRGLTRAMDLSVLDGGFGAQHGVPLGFFPTTRSLGIVLPSNSPGVNSIWIPALALGIPVVLKPGREEPWTPLRIVQALIAAGMPAQAFSFYPTNHEGSAAILELCGRSLLFGDVAVTQAYARDPRVQIHGPGRSKVVIGEDAIDAWPEFLDILVDSIAKNGGRSCVNASAILVPRHADALAEALAKRLAAIEPLPPEDPRATLSAFANPRFAESIDAGIEGALKQPGAVDVTAKHRGGPRHVIVDGAHYLRPTLVRCQSLQHPLANTEYLFPYASVVELPSSRFLEEMGPSLVVTAITRDKPLQRSIIESPLVERLNLGPAPTTRVDWDQPHEGNLFEFLYARRAIHAEAGW